MTSATQPATVPVIDAAALLHHWQGHRALTRRVIEAFPEKELFTFTIGGMRSFALMATELLAIAAPGLKELVTGNAMSLDEKGEGLTTKALILAAWDEATAQINSLWQQFNEARFQETHNLFGQYAFPVYENILYFIDNEIHHRGQGYVYLRALDIEPPFFWERGERA